MVSEVLAASWAVICTVLVMVGDKQRLAGRRKELDLMVDNRKKRGVNSSLYTIGGVISRSFDNEPSPILLTQSISRKNDIKDKNFLISLVP